MSGPILVHGSERLAIRTLEQLHHLDVRRGTRQARRG
jgi:hypothetical protein